MELSEPQNDSNASLDRSFSFKNLSKTSNSSFKSLSKSSSFSSSLTRSSSNSDTYSFNVLNRSSSQRCILSTAVAASYYHGDSSTISKMDSSNMSALNKFLRNMRSEVESGFMGQELMVVIGAEGTDLDSMVAAIAYAFFLATIDQGEKRLYFPVMNLKRADLAYLSDAIRLFEVSGIDVENLCFIDEINLQYHLASGNLKLVLVHQSKLSSKQQVLEDAVVDILDNMRYNFFQMDQNHCPLLENVPFDQGGSCCTLVTERCAEEAPELLLDRGMSRLLLAAILLKTSNLSLRNRRCTQRDECMSTLLLHAAGRLGRVGFYRQLKLHVVDISILSSEELLSRNLKQWTWKCGTQQPHLSSIGMSSLRISLIKFLSRHNAVFEDLNVFLRSHQLELLIIATGFFSLSKNLHREVLMVSHNRNLIDELLEIFDSEDVQLQLKPLHIPGMPKWAVAFSQSNLRFSRKQMQHLLDGILAG